MTRKQQIREASTEWCLRQPRIEAWMDMAFEQGAQWADTHPQSPWISVSDQLPQQYKPVVVLFYNRAIDGSKEYDSCGGFYNSVGEWIAFGYNVQNAKINSTVTHWMPIPDPPQKGGGQ